MLVDLRSFNVLSLFSGGAGLDLGIQLAVPSARTVCFVEREAFACATLARQMEEGGLDPAPVWSDVSTFDGRPWRGVVDCIAGGFPCQDISLAGKRAGIGGERSGLWKHFARIIGEVRPQFVFIENVAALARSGLDVVLSDLAALGFDAEWSVYRASDVGAPHRRARIFVLAYARGGSSAGWRGTGDVPRAARGTESEGDQWQRGGDAARDCSEAVAHASSPGWSGRKGESGDNGSQLSPAERGGSDVVADSVCDGRRPIAFEHPNGLRRSSAGYGVPGTASGTYLADPDALESIDVGVGQILNGERAAFRDDTYGRRLPWPPGPTDAAGWTAYLGRWPGTEPAVRRDSDGLAARVDELRLLGNGVVPDQAAAAFIELYQRVEYGNR